MLLTLLWLLLLLTLLALLYLLGLLLCLGFLQLLVRLRRVLGLLERFMEEQVRPDRGVHVDLFEWFRRPGCQQCGRSNNKGIGINIDRLIVLFVFHACYLI